MVGPRRGKTGKPRSPRPADAAVRFIEHKALRRADFRQHNFQRQHEARHLAARCDLMQIARCRTRVGRHAEAHHVAALRTPFGFGQRFHRRFEPRFFQLQRRQFFCHQLIQFLRGFRTRLVRSFSLRHIGFAHRFYFRLQRRQ